MDGHRLLVVEDHAGTRHALSRIFTRMGWKVFAAETVAEGLAALDSEPEPCLLICDLDLPDGNGQAVMGRLREMGFKTRVVVSSGMVTDARLISLATFNPDAVLPKPINLDEVWAGMCPVCPGCPSSYQVASVLS